MAEGFVEGMTNILGGSGAKVVGGEVSGEAVNPASKVIDSVILGGVNGASEEVEGGGTIDEQVQRGMKESQEDMKDVASKLEKGEPGAAEDAQALQKKWATMFRNVWAGAKKFGSFVGVELAKGALFSAGTTLLQNILTEPAQPGAPAPADDPRVKAIQAINNAGQILQDALDTWTKWQAAHYNDRDSYGAISVEGFSIQIFEILQNSISALSHQRDKMVPLVNAVKQTKSLDDVNALLTADIAFAKAVVDLSGEISSNMMTMTNAGMPAKSVEVQSAYSILVAAGP